MRYPNTAYLWQPTEAEWDQMLRDIPRENLEKALYDLSYDSGAMSGLAVEAQALPNLSVKVRRGRALVRDPQSLRATVAELHADLDLDLTSSRPLGSPTTVLIVIEPFYNPNYGTPVLVPNAPPGTEDHDPLYSPSTFYPFERDECVIRVVGQATAGQVVLASVTLAAADTAIPASRIGLEVRQTATVRQRLESLEARIARLEKHVIQVGDIKSHTGPLGTLDPDYLPCTGQALQRADYPALFARIGVTYGAGDGVNTFNLPDLRDRFVVGAGSDVALGATGGAKEVALSQAQMPVHNHQGSTGPAGGHAHTGQTKDPPRPMENEYLGPIPNARATSDFDAGAHPHFVVGDIGSGTGDTGYNGLAIKQITTSPGLNDFAGERIQSADPNNPYVNVPPTAIAGYGVIAPGSEHRHSLTTNTVADHSHTVSINNAGGGQAHENRPPFIGFFLVMRVR